MNFNFYLAIIYLEVVGMINRISERIAIFLLNKKVIEEYIKYKLDGGFPFNSIFSVGKMFISTIPTGVSIGSHKTAKPYSFTYKGKDYYVTTQLRDNGPTDNFQKFRTAVSKNEPGFQITVF